MGTSSQVNLAEWFASFQKVDWAAREGYMKSLWFGETSTHLGLLNAILCSCCHGTWLDILSYFSLLCFHTVWCNSKSPDSCWAGLATGAWVPCTRVAAVPCRTLQPFPFRDLQDPAQVSSVELWLISCQDWSHSNVRWDIFSKRAVNGEAQLVCLVSPHCAEETGRACGSSSLWLGLI